MNFSDRVKRVKPSFTLEMTTRAAELRAKGVDVINFSVGEPDFNTPDHIIRAGKEAMDNGFTKYTAESGMIELREAICEKLERDNELYYDPNQVLVSNGEKQSLFTACQVLFQEGDEVIIFSPYWVYLRAISMSLFDSWLFRLRNSSSSLPPESEPYFEQS